MKSNRAFTTLTRRLEQHPALFRPWKGTMYRLTTLKYRDPSEILLGEGSYRYGGRWNAMGSFRAVYGSTDDVVALAESKANADYAKLPYPFREPRLVIAADISLGRVLDLTALETLKALEVTDEELRREDWRKVQEQGFESFTQALGRAAFSAKAEGLLARSVRVKDGINVVYFPQNKARESEVRLWEPQQ
ncbi:MAG TPA: RES family NAD+ phosphorylase [Candidatus Udaeobacter sp.]|nr:RES family NAD+ phosphorylase [Candidatus Udaeobacter sp.]